MRRWVVGTAVLLAATAGLAWFVGRLPGWATAAGRPIRVGLLHSISGSMAISEKSMVDAEVLALEQLNDGGGVLGRRVEWVIADGRSDPETFAREARRLIADEKVAVIFGCWNSACRKGVKPVVEVEEHLLIYPVAYEGLEMSSAIVYTGAAPNQQLLPTVKWCVDKLNARRLFLVGSDSVWPHAAHAIIKEQLKSLGADLAGEAFVNDDPAVLDAAVRAINSAGPDLVLSTVEGSTNLAFYQKCRAAGIVPSKLPTLTFALTEDEIRQLPAGLLAGDYAVCNYFQLIDRPENAAFVRAFKARYGADRVTCDAIATAHSSVLLWAQAVTEAETEDVALVRVAILKQSLDAPEGVISLDRVSRHTYRPFFVGRIRGDALIDIVWTLNKPIRPTPFPTTRSREDWEGFLQKLSAGWGGRWEAPPGTRPAPAVAEPVKAP